MPAGLKSFATPATDKEATDSGLVTGQYAGLKAVGKGGVCVAEVFKITKPGLKIWRVFSKSAQSRMGAWWSFDKSDDHYKTRKAWRTDSGVCRDWNPAADGIFSCNLAKGDLIAVGPGQSAFCDDTSINAAVLDKTHYPPSKTVQIFWNGWRRGTPSCSTSMPIKRWTDVEGREGKGPLPGAKSGSASRKKPAAH